jgi:hypothetical protein
MMAIGLISMRWRLVRFLLRSSTFPGGAITATARVKVVEDAYGAASYMCKAYPHSKLLTTRQLWERQSR